MAKHRHALGVDFGTSTSLVAELGVSESIVWSYTLSGALANPWANVRPSSSLVPISSGTWAK